MEQIEHGSVRENHFESQDQVASHAVVEDIDAAGVSADVATNLAAAWCAQTQRKKEVMLGHRILDGFQHATGVNDSREVVYVDTANAIHALKAQDHLRLRIVRDASQHQAGISALRHDGKTEFGTGLHTPGDL